MRLHSGLDARIYGVEPNHGQNLLNEIVAIPYLEHLVELPGVISRALQAIDKKDEAVLVAAGVGGDPDCGIVEDLEPAFGPQPVDWWLESRFFGVSLLPRLAQKGVVVDTVDLSVPWEGVEELIGYGAHFFKETA